MSLTERPIIIGLTGLAGAGKDTVADTLVTQAGFTKLAFADALRLEVAAGFALGDQYGLLSDRAGKETSHPRLAFSWCTDLEFVRHVRHAAFAGVMCVDDIDVPRSPRQILQWWGTEYRRAQAENYWSTKVAMQIAALQADGHTRFVISDCRFPNEAAAIRTLGGEIWQVFRPGLRPVENGHASQTAGDALKPDAFIVNNGTVLELMTQALRMLQKRHGGVIVHLS